MKSIFVSLGNFFKKLFTTQSWQQQAKVWLATLATIAEGILEATGNGDDVAVCTTVVQEVNAALATIDTLIAQYNAAPATVGARIKAELDAIYANLGNLITEGHIKNPASIAKVQGIADLVKNDGALLLGLLPQSSIA